MCCMDCVFAASRALQVAVTKAQEQRPGEDVFEEAKQNMKRRLLEKGWLSEDEALRVPGNGCWFISAVKQQ